MKKRLADIAEIRTGYPFRARVQHDPEGTLAVVQMKDISDAGSLSPLNVVRIAEEPGHQRHLLEVGDVILQSRGNKFPASAIREPIHGIAALGLHILRPKGKVLTEYLVWALNHPKTREALQGVARGSYIPFLSKTDVADLRVPVPSILMQERIVEVERLRRREQRLLAELEQLQVKYVSAATLRAATSK